MIGIVYSRGEVNPSSLRQQIRNLPVGEVLSIPIGRFPSVRSTVAIVNAQYDMHLSTRLNREDNTIEVFHREID